MFAVSLISILQVKTKLMKITSYKLNNRSSSFKKSMDIYHS